MSDLTEDTARELLEALEELRSELRQVRRDGLVARLSEAERELIAGRVYERVDERLSPADHEQLDEAPRPRGKGDYFRRK